MLLLLRYGGFFGVFAEDSEYEIEYYQTNQNSPDRVHPLEGSGYFTNQHCHTGNNQCIWQLGANVVHQITGR